MFSLLSKFFGGLWGYVVGAGAVLVAILAALGIARRSGVKAERAAETERSLQQAKASNAIDTDVHNLTQSGLDKRLRDSQRD